MIYNLLIIDYNDRIEWDDIFRNEWIYGENESENNIEKSGNLDSDNLLIDREYSFDDCFDSINYEISDYVKNLE